MNKFTELVSVIALCYNHEDYLIETLDSILNQTYQNIELVILDDLSKDNSVTLIENWIETHDVNCIFIKHESNKGVCASLNEAIKVCKGNYIQMISCDDVLLSEKIKTQVLQFQKIPDKYGVIYSNAQIIDENSKKLNLNFIEYFIGSREIKEFSGDVFHELTKGNFIPAMSTLIKKEVFDRVGLYDERLIYEDYDFWLRVAREFSFIFIDDSLVYYRLHSSNLHKKISKKEWGKSMLLIALKHLDNDYFYNLIQMEIIDNFFIENDRLILNKYYSNINIHHLNQELTHFFIKYNFPKIFVKLAIRIDRHVG